MSERGALLTAGGAVPGAGVHGAQIMTFMGMKEMQKKTTTTTKYLSF